MKALYVHGFNGSPKGGSYHLLKKHLPAGWTLTGMDYCQEDCGLALKQIRETIDSERIDAVIGSSLGGFLTLLTEGVERYVINPCYHPAVELPKLKACNGLPAPTPEMIESYKVFDYRFQELPEQDKALIHCFIGDKDELFGDKYYEEITRDLGCRPRMVFSSHHLSESAAETVCSLLALKNDPAARNLRDAHKYSWCNEALVQKSANCGCFSCEQIFPASEVEDYIKDEEGRTALCPHCGTDALIPDSCPYDLSEEFLQKMNERWF